MVLVFCDADRLVQVTFLEERVEELEALVEKLLNSPAYGKEGHITVSSSAVREARKILGNKLPD